MDNAYPRVYVTNRITKSAVADLFGPFPSRVAAEAFTSWRRTTPSERSLALFRIADALEARAEDLVRNHALGLAEHVARHADHLD